MTKSSSTVLVFAFGFMACALTLRSLYGLPVNPLQSADDPRAKAAVLTALNTTPSPVRHFTGDSVVADAAAKLEPAIVEIHTVGKAIHTDPNPFAQMFGGGFGNPGGGQVIPKGAGSGVIISPDGYIITNNHVVAEAQTLTVQVGDKGYDAKVVGTDPVSDIAVVKIQAARGETFPVAELGDSSNIRIGDWAIAIGDPLDIGTTVTLGIISALNRKDMQAENHPMQPVIQTDAAINPGNSGGALANINGQVIGINEAIASPTGYYSGIGFAIPINAAKKIAVELIKDGKIVRPYLGVSYAPLKIFPAAARQQMGITIDGDNGVVVQQVYPGSPAAAAGLQVYDVVLEANRQKISDADQLNDLVQKSPVGSTMTLLISRNGQNQILTATLKQRPDAFGQGSSRQGGGDQGGGQQGDQQPGMQPMMPGDPGDQ